MDFILSENKRLQFKKRLMSMPQNGAVISVGYKGNLGPIINGTLKTFSNMLARILA